jgi:hypothetical protein
LPHTALTRNGVVSVDGDPPADEKVAAGGSTAFARRYRFTGMRPPASTMQAIPATPQAFDLVRRSIASGHRLDDHTT